MLQYSELENLNASVYWYQYWGGGVLHVPFISTSMWGVRGGVVYDLNIESKINLEGNAIIKIYVIDY